jgi:hypothetical protein
VPKDDEPRASEDVVLVVGQTDDQGGYRVLRKRNDRIETGDMRPARDGVPIHGEVVKLTPRPEASTLFDVEVLHGGPAFEPTSEARTAADGPAKVATDEYRKGWDAIWGKKRAKKLAN